MVRRTFAPGFRIALHQKDLSLALSSAPALGVSLPNIATAQKPQCGMHFSIIGDIRQVETFAAGSGVRELPRLRKLYGRGRWRKRKGIAKVRLEDGTICPAEVHVFEATGIGKKEFKIKHLL